MGVEELARAFRARREGKNYRAKCPVHKSRNLTLGIYPGKDRSRLICYAGCDSDDILATIGLTWKDLLYKQEWLSPQEFREKMKVVKDREKLERLNRQYGIMLWLSAIDKPTYWAAAAARTSREHNALYRKLYPEQADSKQQQRDFQAKVKSVGWDAIWEEHLKEVQC